MDEEQKQEGWWNEENKLMAFKSIKHAPGIINGSSQAYDEMMEYLDIKIAKARADERESYAKP